MDNRPPVYPDEDTGKTVYRVSAVGGCARSLLKHLDPEAQPDRKPRGFKIAADSGHEFEEEVKGFLEDSGFLVLGDQDEINLKMGSALVRGHIDGIINIPSIALEDLRQLSETYENLRHWDGAPVLFEAKEMSPKRFALWTRHGIEAFPGYAAQLRLYLKGTGMKGAVYCVGLRTRERLNFDPKVLHLSYIDSKDDRLPTYSSIVKKVMTIERYRKTSTEPTCTGRMFWCPWSQQGTCTHDSKGEPIIPPIEIKKPELEEMIIEERRLSALAKAVSAQHKAAADKIKKIMIKGQKITPGQSLKLLTDNPKVKATRYYVSRFSSSKARAKYPEVFEDPECFDLNPQVRFFGPKVNQAPKETEEQIRELLGDPKKTPDPFAFR